MGTPETIVLPEEIAEVAALIERARLAQAAIADYTQEQVDELIRAMVWSCAQPGVAEELAAYVARKKASMPDSFT